MQVLWVELLVTQLEVRPGLLSEGAEEKRK